MSDARGVGIDTRSGALMQALADTVGMTRPQQAAFWLEGIAKAVHRGPKRDTWTTARDRAAEIAGIERSMAKRIWQRWQDMKGVDGDALLKLMIAYEAIRKTSEAGDHDLQNSSAASARLAGIIAAVRQVEHGQVGDRRL